MRSRSILQEMLKELFQVEKNNNTRWKFGFIKEMNNVRNVIYIENSNRKFSQFVISSKDSCAQLELYVQNNEPQLLSHTTTPSIKIKLKWTQYGHKHRTQKCKTSTRKPTRKIFLALC